MSDTKKIFEAISGIMSEIGAIGKDKVNTQQNFKYRGVDDVMNALQPILVKHGVFVVPEIVEQTREERTSKNGATLIYSVCKIKYTFYATDGSSVTAVIVGEGMDSGDKATNKAMAIAFKYACFQVFCIPTEEMKDPDGESHKVNPSNKQSGQSENGQGSGNSNAQKPLSEAQVKRFYAIAKKAGFEVDDAAKLCQLKYGKSIVEQLAIKEYNNICKALEENAEVILDWYKRKTAAPAS